MVNCSSMAERVLGKWMIRASLITMRSVISVDLIHPITGCQHRSGSPGKPDIAGVMSIAPLVSYTTVSGVTNRGISEPAGRGQFSFGRTETLVFDLFAGTT